MPVFFAETRRAGFPDFLKQQQLPAEVAVEERNGLVAFGPKDAIGGALPPHWTPPSGGFKNTPFYTRIDESYRNGAGILLAGDLVALGAQHASSLTGGARYFIAEQKEVNNQMEARAAIGFDGPRTGMAAWLADTVAHGFARLRLAGRHHRHRLRGQESRGHRRWPGRPAERRRRILRAEVPRRDARKRPASMCATISPWPSAASSRSRSMAPAIPVPSWKLVTEVYDPAKLQATLQKFAEAYNRETVKTGNAPLRTAQEVYDGRTYYMIAGGDGSPLTEAHYTFADGYLIAGPTRALVASALQVKTSRRFHHALAAISSRWCRATTTPTSPPSIYQNLGTTLAPLAGLLGGMLPQGRGPQDGPPI